MQLTDYHAQYFAHELTRRCPPDSAEKLAGAVASAQVDLNPHQVDAALFAFQSPLSKGALLADEVGPGKTIEAGSAPILDESTRIAQARNVFGAHFGAISFELLDSDAIGFGQQVLSLVDRCVDGFKFWLAKKLKVRKLLVNVWRDPSPSSSSETNVNDG